MAVGVSVVGVAVVGVPVVGMSVVGVPVVGVAVAGVAVVGVAAVDARATDSAAKRPGRDGGGVGGVPASGRGRMVSRRAAPPPARLRAPSLLPQGQALPHKGGGEAAVARDN
jgi:hypothetical protein